MRRMFVCPMMFFGTHERVCHVGVCRLGLPGLRTCALFEEGTLYLWMGGLAAPSVGLGVKRGGSENLREVGCVRVGQLSRYSQVLLLPLGVPPMPALACSTQSLAQDSEI